MNHVELQTNTKNNEIGKKRISSDSEEEIVTNDLKNNRKRNRIIE